MNKVITFIVIATAVAIVLSGCSSSVEKYNQNYLYEICNFSRLGNLPDFGGYHHAVYYDTTTGVMYMLTYGLNVISWVPLFNADGTPKVWQENKSM